MNEQLDRVEKMLRAQLKSAGHIWWVGGYVYGVTSNNDLFVILYPADDKLNEKVVRVYPHDFKKLPAFIPTEGIDGGDTEANPNKEQARRKGIYHECPLFEIVTFDGRETQMGRERRFGDVLRVSKRKQEPAASPPVPNRQSVAPETPPRAQQIHMPGTGTLPNYREMALKAKTATEFDYAAFMTAEGRLYTEQERITTMREVLIPGWKPGEPSNTAMLAALEIYQRKRLAAENIDGDLRKAHELAKRDALNAYNKAME